MKLFEKQKLHIYNSLSKTKEEFTPINKDSIGMYVCGPTVYSNVHLGNCRTFLSFDLVFRYLKIITPLPEYVALRLQLQKDAGKIDQMLLKIKKGEEDEVFDLMVQNAKDSDIISILKRMSDSFRSVSDFSAANKRVQKIFFDSIFNPFKIYMDSNGKMNIRVNYFIAGSF